jgi:hypothetical protein
MTRLRPSFARIAAAASFAFAVSLAVPASAQERIENPIAVFSGLDKITARIITFEAEIDETVQFGALQLTARACYTRPPTESPNTTSFIEVDEIGLDNTIQRIFTGWVFAASPGLSAVEHPVYDVWLIDCLAAPAAAGTGEAGAETAGPYVPPQQLGVPEFGPPPLPPPRPRGQF